VRGCQTTTGLPAFRLSPGLSGTDGGRESRLSPGLCGTDKRERRRSRRIGPDPRAGPERRAGLHGTGPRCSPR